MNECIPGYSHSHIVQDRRYNIWHSVCQRCHKTLYFNRDQTSYTTGWITRAFVVQEWP
jgi:hypothetical protein